MLGAIIEMSYPYRVRISGEESNEYPFVWPEGMDNDRAQIDEYFALTSLACILAIDRNPPVALTRLWTLTFDPLSFGSNISWRSNASSPVEFYSISAKEEGSEVSRWAEIVTAADAKRIDIAIRRILSAGAERPNPEDGFVDAVIAWENIFAGTSQGGTIFQNLCRDVKAPFGRLDGEAGKTQGID
ncbi:hypothetical protein JNW88_19335 [Micromonospora sp. ATA32]|nr:hypothetical protein [Micromonospora sp. ATA32]